MYLLPDRFGLGGGARSNSRAARRHRGANRRTRDIARTERRSDDLDGDLRSRHAGRGLQACPCRTRAGARRDLADGGRAAPRRRVRPAAASPKTRQGVTPGSLTPMCLALIAFGAHPRLRLVVAANRDEYHGVRRRRQPGGMRASLRDATSKPAGARGSASTAAAALRSSPMCVSLRVTIRAPRHAARS